MERTLATALGLCTLLRGLHPDPARADERHWQALPQETLFAPYAADPHRVGFGVGQHRYSETAIPGVGDDRVSLRTGARIGLARLEPEDGRGTRWQVGLPVGFDAVFDHSHGEDNIGWDGNYGLLVTAAPAPDLAFKAGILHTSSHIGDELIERTGRERIDYTREEWLAAVSWRPGRSGTGGWMPRSRPGPSPGWTAAAGGWVWSTTTAGRRWGSSSRPPSAIPPWSSPWTSRDLPGSGAL